MGGTCCVTREKSNYQGEFEGSHINEVQQSLHFITDFLDKSIFPLINSLETIRS